MLKLIRLDSDQFRVVSTSHKIDTTGSLEQAVISLMYCDVEPAEALFAVDSMELRGHTHADFGVNGTFIFSAVQEAA